MHWSGPALLSLVLAAAALTPSAAAAAPRTLVMEVQKSRNSSLTNGRFDNMARDAALIATTKDGAQDVACPELSIARSGDVIEHQTLPKLINTQQQLNMIQQLPIDVFVMDDLALCGSTASSLVVGCERPGPILVEAGGDSFMTLIHEVGHRAGRGHTVTPEQCRNNTIVPALRFNNILYCKRHSARKWMTADDCTRIKATSSFQDGQPDLVMDLEELMVATVEPPTYTPGQELLLTLFGETFELASIEALTDEQVELIRVEFYSEDPRFWDKAAYVLAIRGTSRDLEAIVALAHRAANVETPEGFRARVAVPEAIGMYYAHHQDQPMPDWIKDFLVRNVVVDNAMIVSQGDADDASLIAESYARGAGLAGDVDTARAVLELVDAQNLPPEVGDAVALRAIAAESSTLEQTLAGEVQVAGGDFRDILRERSMAGEIDPAVVDTLRDLGIAEGGLISDFYSQQFMEAGVVLERLDERLLELKLNAPGGPATGGGS